MLKPDIFASIMDFFASNVPILTEDQPASDTGETENVSIILFNIKLCTSAFSKMLFSYWLPFLTHCLFCCFGELCGIVSKLCGPCTTTPCQKA